MKNIYFTPGPAELYFTLETHIKNALKLQVPSISHRSATFQGIYQEAEDNLKALLGIPEDYHIFFTGSATEVWERVLQNCVRQKSHHYVNGAFSKRFFQTATELGKAPTAEYAEDGSCLKPDSADIPEDTELIAFTQNETSTGAAQPLEDIYRIRHAHPDKLIAVDAVSTLPYPNFNYSQLDTVFFSVQKGFGLPAGLGVWILSPRAVEKAQQIAEEGYSLGSYHSIPSFIGKAQKHQTPETPNVLNIYLLAKVSGDMLGKGIDKIRQETEYKAALLYHTLEDLPGFSPFVKTPAQRSKTVIVAECEASSASIIDKLKKSNMVLGGGYGQYKDRHIRIANFPTHSREQVELLADTLQKIS